MNQDTNQGRNDKILVAGDIKNRLIELSVKGVEMPDWINVISIEIDGDCFILCLKPRAIIAAFMPILSYVEICFTGGSDYSIKRRLNYITIFICSFLELFLSLSFISEGGAIMLLFLLGTALGLGLKVYGFWALKKYARRIL